MISPLNSRVNRAESYAGFIKVSNYHPSLERIDKTAESCTEPFPALNHGAMNEGLSTTNMPIIDSQKPKPYTKADPSRDDHLNSNTTHIPLS